MTLALTRRGAGEPLLLLHGIGMCKEWWSPLLGRLGAHHEVLAVDFPGHGESPPFPPEREPSIAGLTDAILALAREEGFSRPHVAGISMGGLVSLELARRGAVATATAFSPGGFAAGWQRRWLDGSLRLDAVLYPALVPFLRPLTRFRAALSRQIVADGSRIPPEDFVHFARAAARSELPRTRSCVVGYDYPFVPRLPCPVTVAWGQKDLLLFPSQAERAAAQLPGSRKVNLMRAGHIPVYDDPDGTVRAILDTTSRAPAS